MKTIKGWVFNICLAGRGIQLHVIDAAAQVQTLRDEFTPSFYASGDANDLRALARFMIDQPWEVRLVWTQFMDQSVQFPVSVLRLDVLNSHHFPNIVQRVMRTRPKLKYHNADIPVLAQYISTRGIVPFAVTHFVVDDEQWILGIEVDRSHNIAARPRLH